MKLNWTLLDFNALEEAVKVLQTGCGNHIADSWRNEPIQNDIESLLRHVVDYQRGIKIDKKSGLHSIAHALCRCVFILAKDLNETAKEKFKCTRCQNEYQYSDSAYTTLKSKDIICKYCADKELEF